MKKIKPVKAWAIVDHGELTWFMTECFPMIFASKSAAMRNSESDTEEVIAVEIRPIKPKRKGGRG